MKLAGCFLGRADTLPFDRDDDTAGNQDENESMFWAEVHKEILLISSAPPEVKAKSREWLTTNGYLKECNSA
ncbi:MAG: hypothetical protein ACOYU3_08475 [Bacillota bacterium]